MISARPGSAWYDESDDATSQFLKELRLIE